MLLFFYCHRYYFSIQISVLKLVFGTCGGHEIQDNSKNYVVQLPSYRWKLNYRQAMKFNFVTPQRQRWCCNCPGIAEEQNVFHCTNFILNINILKHKILIFVGHISMYQSALLYFLPSKFDYFFLDKKERPFILLEYMS
jgi:hypothetical protein